jgi:hypothetical protein
MANSPNWKSIALHSIAKEIFRDQADKDYITSRATYRMRLREQFLWAALQACEKYLKGILLFNELSARYPHSFVTGQTWNKKKEFGHDLETLFSAVKEINDLNLAHPKWMPDFLRYLSEFGFNRYLTTSTYTVGDELRKLDETAWTLRRYCQSFTDWEVSGVVKATRSNFIASVNRPHHRQKPARSRPFGVIDGFLETVLKRKTSDFARKNLIWNNLFFATRQRSSASYVSHSSSENPPQNREWFTDKLKAQMKDYVRL